MVTLDELYNEPRFREMSEEELADVLYSKMDFVDVSNIEPINKNRSGYHECVVKARNLIAKWKAEEKSIPEKKPLRLKEGMGVVNATLEQQKAIVEIAETVGLNYEFSCLGEPDSFGSAGFNGKYIESVRESVVKHPVTFREFCQAILNEPEKPKEETVKLNNRYRAVIWSGGVNLMLNGKTETSFPLSIVDELVAAKERVTK